MTMTYILHPGHVKSEDGDLHYISAHRLAELYQVTLGQCRIYDLNRPQTIRGFKKQEGDICLYPRIDGDYRLPQAIKKGV